MGSPGCKGKTLSLLNLALMSLCAVNLEIRHAGGPSSTRRKACREPRQSRSGYQQRQAWKQAIDKQNGLQ
jgi:hypothetical protein